MYIFFEGYFWNSWTFWQIGDIFGDTCSSGTAHWNRGLSPKIRDVWSPYYIVEREVGLYTLSFYFKSADKERRWRATYFMYLSFMQVLEILTTLHLVCRVRKITFPIYLPKQVHVLKIMAWLKKFISRVQNMPCFHDVTISLYLYSHIVWALAVTKVCAENPPEIIHIQMLLNFKC